ncbi:MAG: DNA polymerase III subunit delta [Deltaproteobacteria bacterium]|nr:DNA polymerase III subunit delta [Deltaproteobacteria bacterium]
MSHPLLERHLKRSTLKPLYLFYGDEEFLMLRALERLGKALTGPDGEAPVKVVLEAQEIGLPEFLAQARMTPLWGAGQLLVLRRVETYPAKPLKAVLDYLDHPAPRARVVLLAPGLKARDLAKNAVWSRLQQEEAALGFFHLKEGELQQWLTREAQAQGKTLTLAGAQRLVDMVGDNLSELASELEKLTLFAGPEKTLTPNLVSQLASHSRTYNIFALVDALGESGAQKRLSALAHLLDLGEPPARILVMLARQLRLLLRLKDSPAGAPPEALARALEVPPGIVKKLAKQAARFTTPTLQTHLRRLHQTDRQLKTSMGNPRLWLEWCLLQMGPG